MLLSALESSHSPVETPPSEPLESSESLASPDPPELPESPEPSESLESPESPESELGSDWARYSELTQRALSSSTLSCHSPSVDSESATWSPRSSLLETSESSPGSDRTL